MTQSFILLITGLIKTIMLSMATLQIFLDPSGLLLVDLDDVVLLHLEGLGRLVIVDAAPVEEEAQWGDGDAHTLGVALLELAHGSGHLDAEVDLVRVLADDLQLDVLGLVLVLRHGGGGVFGAEMGAEVGVGAESSCGLAAETAQNCGNFSRVFSFCFFLFLFFCPQRESEKRKEQEQAKPANKAPDAGP